MLLLRPLACGRILDVGSPGPCVRLRPVVRRPGGERESASPTADAGELSRDAVMVGREDRAERGRDRVKLGIGVRELLGIALVEPDRQPLGSRRATRLLELVGGDVDADDVGAGARGTERDATGSARDVEHPVAGLNRERGDDAVVNRREGLCDALVARSAPNLGGPGHVSRYGAGQAGTFAPGRAPSSLRTRRSILAP